ncbi:hypothetical protein [Arthrobacter sp. NPDC090010]|uniref:hypothetical protein n=1 Tax=Arthrobacter sp. NPDC090010 TaxID=3363942 RepID=UPI0037F2DC8A
MFTPFTPAAPAHRSLLSRMFPASAQPLAPAFLSDDDAVRELAILRHKARQEAEELRRELDLAKAQAYSAIR